MSNERVRIIKHNSNGNVVAEMENKRGYLGGYYLKTNGEPSVEEIAQMKEKVVEAICSQIREIARTNEDFFIIKRGEDFPGVINDMVTTIGAKFVLPTVKADYGI